MWGSATSSYQVEGDIYNCDWADWEKGHIRNNDRAGKACNHLNLYTQDFDLAKSLGHNAHRLSLEWSRIEPEEGVWNEAALDHYACVLESLKARDIEPMVTLHHFTNPKWLGKYGYWTSPEMPKFFTRFVKKVAERLLPLSKFWVTLNEPVLVAYMGYMENSWPPGKADFKEGMNAFYHMIEAHANAYHALHEEAEKKNLKVMVGVAKHMRIIDPSHFSNPMNLLICSARSFFFNKLFLETIHTGSLHPPFSPRQPVPWAKGTQDFIGLNYYTRDHIAFDFKKPSFLFGKDIKKKNIPRSAMGWQIYPRGLFRLLKYLKKFKLPIYITENGIATQNDDERIKFIRDHLKQVVHALKEKVDVKGYFYWSLMDNFEWLDGFEPKFGLLEVNYDTFRRTIRPSAEAYKGICQTNELKIN